MDSAQVWVYLILTYVCIHIVIYRYNNYIKNINNYLKFNEEKLKMSMDVGSDGIWDLDFENEEVYYSLRWEDVFGCICINNIKNFSTPEKRLENENYNLKKISLRDIMYEDDYIVLTEKLYGYIKNEVNRFEIEINIKNSKNKWVLVKGQLFYAEDNKTLKICGTHTDISQIKRIHSKLRKSEEFYRNLYNNSSLIMFVVDFEYGNIVDANEAACKFYGYAKREFLQLKIHDVNTMEDEKIQEEMLSVKTNNKHYFNFTHKLKSGELRQVEVHSGMIMLDSKYYLYSIIHDITENKIKEEQINTLIYKDSLTNLYNRAYFMKDLENQIEVTKESKKLLGVLFMDLDGFKSINDNLGHNIGDLLLIEVGKRLLATLRSEDIVARIGGDEFTCLIKGIENEKYIKEVSQRIVQVCSKPFSIDDKDIYISASVGVAIYPSDGADSNLLIKNADIAMYKAKDHGKNKYIMYSEDINEKIKEEFAIENELRFALKKNELYLEYQPIYDVRDNKIKGVEALIRWENEKLGKVSPNKFIKIAEKNSLIYDIGEWVLYNSCKTLKQWHDKGYDYLFMSVNISVRQLIGQNFVEKIATLIREIQIDPSFLFLEITESISMENIEYIYDVLNKMKEIGVNIAMDDFGTGYSSLAVLKNLYITKLKIDKSFIDDINKNSSGMAVVSTIIAMAKALNIKVIAEGVETNEQLVFLRINNCDMIQGYLISRPLPQDEILNLIKNSI